MTNLLRHTVSKLNTTLPDFAVLKELKPTRKKRFAIKDNGTHNVLTTGNNKVIGQSVITFRAGNNNHIKIGRQGKFNNLKIDINGHNNQVTIGDQVKFSGQLLIVGDDLSIHIGDNTTAISCYILARDKSVFVGSECMISRDVEIRASDVHKVIDIHTDKRVNPAIKDVHIGNHIWIAANVTVSKNVSIADGCILAAGAFINKSVSTPNVMLAGVPAKVIRQHVRWER